MDTQIGSIITANILTAVGAGILYALYVLAGDYLTTFVFMTIFAIALTSIRKSIINSLETSFRENKEIWQKHRIYRLHAAKFSYIFKLLIGIYRCSVSFPHLKKTAVWIVKSIFDISFIPYAFLFYVLAFKLGIAQHVMIFDILLWTIVDIFRFIKFVFGLARRPTGNNSQEGLVQWVKGTTFGSLLFYSVILAMTLVIPVCIALIYNDIMTYKNDLVPKLKKYSIPEEYKQYLTAEYLLSQLDNEYISQATVQQIYQTIYSNETQNNYNKFLEVFYGTHATEVFEQIHTCEGSVYCQAKILAMNYKLLNTEVYEYTTYGWGYIQQIAPSLQKGFGVISEFIMNAFSNSLTFIVQFIVFQQGVLYLLTESNLKVKNLIIFNTNPQFRDQLSKNVKKHISGVFVALFTIFGSHFMLSFILLDFLDIKLAFIQSLLLALFSLTQVIDPAQGYIVIVALWQTAGYFNGEFEIYGLDMIETIAAVVIFYLASGMIYEHSFKRQLGDSYWTGMSLILGYVAFEWQGILFGPLLVGAVRTFTDILIWYTRQDHKVEINQDEKVSQKKPLEEKEIPKKKKAK